MSAMIAGSSGFVCGRNRSTSPEGRITNFSKFQATGPATPAWSFVFFSAL